MSVSGSQVAEHYGSQVRAFSDLIDAHKQTLAKVRSADAAVEQELRAAVHDLAAIYLGSLEDASLARAAQLTGFQGFVRRDPRVAQAQERKVLTASLQRIEADDRYVRRDLLVGTSGTLTQELDNAREALAPLQAECDRFESQEGFLELIEVGYDTPAFKEHWWNAGYWRHWAAGDRICKALRFDDFGDDVVPAYRKYAEPRDVLRADVKRIEGEIEAVHQLVQEHDRAQDRLAHLDEIYLTQAQDFLGEHLAHADLGLLEQWIANEPEARAVQQGLRRVAGVQAKRKLLGEIANQGVPQLIKQLDERRLKASAKMTKFLRAKNQSSYFDDRMISPDARSKTQALAAQQHKLDRRIDQLVKARDYSRFELRNDSELWWWYFFDAPPSRYYTPSLWDYYQRRPDAVVMTDDLDDPGDAPARALAAGGLEDGAYLS
jgi:hypothetical protein